MDLSRMNNGGGDFEQPPIGTHNAVCVAVIDIGTQKTNYQGQEKDTPQIVIRWEIDERMSDGKRFMVQGWYTASMNEKAKLRAHLEAWRGLPFKDADFAPGGFSLQKLLNAGCMLNIQHGETGKAKVTSVMKLPKGMAPLKAEVEPFLLDLQPGAFDRECFDALGKGMQDMIRRSPEWAKLNSNGAPPKTEPLYSSDLDDEIPF